MVVVVFPSPAGVGVIADTSISRPVGSDLASASSETLAFPSPQTVTSRVSRPSAPVTSRMGRGLVGITRALFSVGGTGLGTRLGAFEVPRSIEAGTEVEERGGGTRPL